ncbi:guanine nucleotide exchange factor [Anaeramoeba ignava]|uniref:Guanine nucleotide exchange factor n=1 Tax=Anaeramoeba ignava TaxID=1746090 RepID=A0A9Q0LI71_ANAIG|nr:guanine nucleotide exchange factor [Anaeramoeba ignava]
MQNNQQNNENLENDISLNSDNNSNNNSLFLDTLLSIDKLIIKKEQKELNSQQEVVKEIDNETGLLKIKFITLEKLIQFLTSSNRFDDGIAKSFIYTFQKILSAKELLSILEQKITSNFIIDSEKSSKFNEIVEYSVQIPTRKNAIQFLKSWIKTNPTPFISNKALLTQTEKLVNDHIKSISQEEANSINELLAKNKKLLDPFIHDSAFNLDQLPKSILPENLHNIKMIDIDPEEFARQLSLFFSLAFNSIQIPELLHQKWVSEILIREEAENIYKCFYVFNSIQSWVIQSILNNEDAKIRANYISHSIQIAHRCFELNNFYALFAIMSGLQSDSIFRLRNSWEHVSVEQKRQFDKLTTVVNPANNYRKYRQILSEINFPCIPFLDLILYDISLIESEHETFHEKNKKLINLKKLSAISKIVEFMQLCQLSIYKFRLVQAIHTYLDSLQPKSNFDEFLEISLKLEPKAIYQDKFCAQKCSTPRLRESISESGLILKDELAEQDKIVSDEDDEDDYLLFYDKNKKKYQIQAAIVKMLVKFLTKPRSSDQEFLQTFLLTYRSFTSPSELLNLLKERCIEEPPEDCQGANLEIFKKNQSLTKLKVFNVLNHWIKSHFYDFINDPSIIEEVQSFIENTKQIPGLEKPSEQLGDLLKKKQENQKKKVEYSKSIIFPKPILPKTTTNLKTTDIDPLELARQVALIEFDLYKAIQPKECLGEGWLKPDKETRAPNIIKMTEMFNKIGVWIAGEIVAPEKPKSRAAMISYFIKFSQKCNELNNFNSIQEVIAGLTNSAVHRLKKTWELVPPRQIELYQEMQRYLATDDNSKFYRETLKSRNPPCIPYLGVYFTDLVFIGNGNRDFISSKNGSKELINFEKRRKISTVISDIQTYQQMPYFFEKVPEIFNFIMDSISNSKDSKAIYSLSLIREPREKKKVN